MEEGTRDTCGCGRWKGYICGREERVIGREDLKIVFRLP